jgi:hypothetical protein
MISVTAATNDAQATTPAPSFGLPTNAINTPMAVVTTEEWWGADPRRVAQQQHAVGRGREDDHLRSD